MLAGAFVKKGPKRAPRPGSPGGGEPPGNLAESRPVPTLAPAQRGSAGGGSSPDAPPGNRPFVMETHPGMSPADHETTHCQQPLQRDRG